MNRLRFTDCVLVFSVLSVTLWFIPSSHAEPLPRTKPLDFPGDPAAAMVAGIHKYLDRELAASVEKRKQFWKPDFSSPEAYSKSVEPNRQRLKKILGVVDQRLPPAMELVATTDQPALVAETERYKVYAVRWPVLPGVDGEGLLLEPTGEVIASAVAIPDADSTPERIVGLVPGVRYMAQFARKLAESGFRVIVPTLIDRKDDCSGNSKLNKWTNQPHREFVYRMAYEMGRHVIGYEVQKVLAAVDWLFERHNHGPIGVYGDGEGGLVAMFSLALDDRIARGVVGAMHDPQRSCASRSTATSGPTLPSSAFPGMRVWCCPLPRSTMFGLWKSAGRHRSGRGAGEQRRVRFPARITTGFGNR